jgi:hypothetical protein
MIICFIFVFIATKQFSLMGFLKPMNEKVNDQFEKRKRVFRSESICFSLCLYPILIMVND